MALDDLTINEVMCSECGKPISSIPPWLAGARVKFQCEECRQKHPRIPGMAEIDLRRTAAPDEVVEVVEGPEVVVEEEVEAEEEPDEYAE